MKKKVKYTSLIKDTIKISSIVDQSLDIIEDFNILINTKSKEQKLIDSSLESQINTIDSSKYGIELGLYIPPFYILDDSVKKYLYGIKSKYTLLYFSDTSTYAYREPFIDSIYTNWFSDINYRQSVYTLHISLSNANEHMFSIDSLPGRSISNFKEHYNNGLFDLKNMFNLTNIPKYYLLDSSKRIIAINPNINIIQSFIKPISTIVDNK